MTDEKVVLGAVAVRRGKSEVVRRVIAAAGVAVLMDGDAVIEDDVVRITAHDLRQMKLRPEKLHVTHGYTGRNRGKGKARRNWDR